MAKRVRLVESRAIDGDELLEGLVDVAGVGGFLGSCSEVLAEVREKTNLSVSPLMLGRTLVRLVEATQEGRLQGLAVTDSGRSDGVRRFHLEALAPPESTSGPIPLSNSRDGMGSGPPLRSDRLLRREGSDRPCLRVSVSCGEGYRNVVVDCESFEPLVLDAAMRLAAKGVSCE